MNGVWGKGKRKSTIGRTGSSWTVAKLDAIATYLRTYTIAGLRTPGRKGYIDAFVGANYCEMFDELVPGASPSLLMPDLASSEPRALLDGMTRMALETNPAFHAYIFLDRSPQRATVIEDLQRELSNFLSDDALRSRPARVEIEALCSMAWKDRRAVMFLDPFGMDVDWEIIEAIARTGSIDLWLLYPLGLGVARLAGQLDGKVERWRRHLDRFLDTNAWYDDLLAAKPEPQLFQDDESCATARARVLAKHFECRLQSIFPVVAAQPQVLLSPARQPLYLCSFATGNEGEAASALRMATALLHRLGK
jgi:three-Cys-motif partner protein